MSLHLADDVFWRPILWDESIIGSLYADAEGKESADSVEYEYDTLNRPVAVHLPDGISTYKTYNAEQEHGMDILCNKGEEVINLNFYIQACNPKTQCTADCNDKTLADAIEGTFPLKTENAILMWNHIGIPLSYKYDISYMMDDILMLLNMLQSKEKGELTIHWLPDTFRCDWTMKWNAERLDVQSHWENTVGNLEVLLNEKSHISLKKEDFIKEWKSILQIVIAGLKKCGYSVDKIKNMKQLIEQYENINGAGILYNN